MDNKKPVNQKSSNFFQNENHVGLELKENPKYYNNEFQGGVIRIYSSDNHTFNKARLMLDTQSSDIGKQTSTEMFIYCNDSRIFELNALEKKLSDKKFTEDFLNILNKIEPLRQTPVQSSESNQKSQPFTF